MPCAAQRHRRGESAEAGPDDRHPRRPATTDARPQPPARYRRRHRVISTRRNRHATARFRGCRRIRWVRRRRSCPGGSSRSPGLRGCSTRACRTWPARRWRPSAAPPCRPTPLRRPAVASTSVTPRSSARAMTHATWRAWTSSRYGKFTVNPDCAMLSTKQFGKPLHRAGRAGCGHRRASLSVSVCPSRPIISKPVRRE